MFFGKRQASELILFFLSPQAQRGKMYWLREFLTPLKPFCGNLHLSSVILDDACMQTTIGTKAPYMSTKMTMVGYRRSLARATAMAGIVLSTGCSYSQDSYEMHYQSIQTELTEIKETLHKLQSDRSRVSCARAEHASK